MEGAFWILIFTIIVGIFLYIGELRWRRTHPKQDSASPEESNVQPENGEQNGKDPHSGESSECCGLHLVCEKDSLSPMSEEILYYDDEELDRFVGRKANSYSVEEEEEFREVLMTLRQEDVAGWARSITQRHLELPSDVRDELLMLVNEQRNKKRS